MNAQSSVASGIPPADYFDRLILLAAAVCGTPIALSNYFANGWQHNLMAVGMRPQPVPIESTICVHTLERGDLLIVPDTHADERFRSQPYVSGDPHIRFYAGIPIFDTTDRAHGTLCVLDRVPRQLNPSQTANLRQLARLLSSYLRHKAA